MGRRVKRQKARSFGSAAAFVGRGASWCENIQRRAVFGRCETEWRVRFVDSAEAKPLTMEIGGMLASTSWPSDVFCENLQDQPHPPELERSHSE